MGSGKQERSKALSAQLGKANPTEDARRRERWLERLREEAGDAPPPFAEYVEIAILGMCLAFEERGIPPDLPGHRSLLHLLVKDVSGMCRQLQQSGHSYSREDLLFRAYDYGMRRAYHLDWELYGSQTSY